MAWIESHQDLRTNPKAKRLARMLDIDLAQAIGHLHMLWWWAIDHAGDDGNLGRLDAYDIADAAGWDGDAERFVEALIGCGQADRSGFLECAASGHLMLHDWAEYTAALRASRAGAARGNHNRWHRDRGITDPSCPFCASPPESPPSQGRIAPRYESGIAPESVQESTDLPTNPPTNQGHARASHADDLPPPPSKNGRGNKPLRWDHAWTRIEAYVRRWSMQDPDKPDIADQLDPRAHQVLASIGGISAVRRGEVNRFDYRDAWKQADQEGDA